MRRFCFTLNNYTLHEYNQLVDKAHTIFKLFFMTKEVGESGTPHLQGYCELVHPISTSGLQRKMAAIDVRRCAFLIAKGTARQNYVYCVKTKPDGKPDFMIGEILCQKRKDYDEKDAACQMLKSGKTVKDVALAFPHTFLKFHSGLDKYFFLTQKSRDGSYQTIGYWLSGPTGLGKSRWALTNFPDAYYKDPETDWWDGYLQQETVVIDDYRPTKALTFTKLLRLLDRYPMTIQVKGATLQFASKRVIFTSPLPLIETFSSLEWLKDEQMDQLQRRMRIQLHFNKENSSIMNLLTHSIETSSAMDLEAALPHPSYQM